MKFLSLSALLAAGVLAGMTAANAADLGGNCCADLEERIAELEATTARKGNRKVSLTVSGWVGQQLMVWDDGVRTKAYVTDLGTTLASHVKFTGSAAINSEWSAGYVLHIEAINNDPLFVSQTASVGGAGVGVLQSFWFLKSTQLGKLSIGKQSSAADNVAILPDGSGSLVAANYVLFDNNSFFLRKNGALTDEVWGSFATCPKIQIGVSADCDGVPNNNVRYDTPTFGGFSASASWGESDIWAVAGRYAGEFHEFKLAAAIAYTESTDGPTGVGINGIDQVTGSNARRKGAALQIGAYAQHIPTGLFVYGAYGKDYNSDLQTANEKAVVGNKPDGDNFYVKVGIRQKWHSLGHTVLFGEYGENNNKQSLDAFQEGVVGSKLSQWGLGVVQEIDAAAMSVWFIYREFSLDLNCSTTTIQGNGFEPCNPGLSGRNVGGTSSLDDLRIFKVGGMINF